VEGETERQNNGKKHEGRANTCISSECCKIGGLTANDEKNILKGTSGSREKGNGLYLPQPGKGSGKRGASSERKREEKKSYLETLKRKEGRPENFPKNISCSITPKQKNPRGRPSLKKDDRVGPGRPSTCSVTFPLRIQKKEVVTVLDGSGNAGRKKKFKKFLGTTKTGPKKKRKSGRLLDGGGLLLGRKERMSQKNAGVYHCPEGKERCVLRRTGAVIRCRKNLGNLAQKGEDRERLRHSCNDGRKKKTPLLLPRGGPVPGLEKPKTQKNVRSEKVQGWGGKGSALSRKKNCKGREDSFSSPHPAPRGHKKRPQKGQKDRPGGGGGGGGVLCLGGGGVTLKAKI